MTRVGIMRGGVAARTSAALCAVVIAGAVGGCGGDGTGPGAEKPSVTAKPSAAKPSAAKPSAGGSGRSTGVLGQLDLEKAAIGAADLPGSQVGTVVGKGSDGMDIPPVIVDVTRIPRISPAACEPLYDMTQSISRHQYHAIVEQSVSTAGGDDGTTTETALTSYSAADAPLVLADLRTSLRTCSTFRSREPGESYGDPTALATPRVGDEAVAYRITHTVPSVDDTGNFDGGTPVKAPITYTVVRSGPVVTVFSVMGFPGEPLPVVPMDVVTAQIAKLTDVERAMGVS